jgi:hypothetical protein
MAKNGKIEEIKVDLKIVLYSFIIFFIKNIKLMPLMLLYRFATAGLFEYILCCGESVRGWNLSVY